MKKSSHPKRWQQIVYLMTVFLIIALWMAIVTALAVAMILNSASSSPNEFDKLDFYDDPGMWELY